MSSEEKSGKKNYFVTSFLLHEYGFVFYRVMSVPYLPCRFPFCNQAKCEPFCQSNCVLLQEDDFKMLSKRLIPDENYENLNCFAHCSDNSNYISGIFDSQDADEIIDYTEPLTVRKLYQLQKKLKSKSNSQSAVPANIANISKQQTCIRFWLSAYIYCRHDGKDKFKKYFEDSSSSKSDNFIAELLDFYNREFYIAKEGDCDMVYFDDIKLPVPAGSVADYGA